MSSIASSSRTSRQRGGSVSEAGASGASDEGINSPGHDEGEWEGLSTDEAEEPVKKKARKSTKGKGKGKSKLPKKDVGKLSKLIEMPLEILIEVAGHLDPMTLLHMSRASKAFNAVFASRKTKAIWQAARGTVDLPDLEADDISEMAYAALMFDKVCHGCGKDRAQILIVDLRKRFCKPCQKSSLTPAHWFGIYYPDLDLHRHTLNCLPGTKKTFTKNGFDHYFMESLFETNDELHGIQQRIGNVSSASVLCKNMPPMYRPGPLQFGPGEDEMKNYVEKKVEWVKAIKSDAETLNVWLESQASQRGQAYHDIKQKRREGIEEKLVALGYDLQDFHARNSEIKKVLDQPRPLTDAIWSRISATIIAHVETNRDRRHEREKAQRIGQAKIVAESYWKATKDSVQSQDKHVDLPPFVDIADIEVLQPFFDPDNPVELNAASWASVSDSVVEQGLQLARSFKIKVAQQIATALAGTPHALNSSIGDKLLPADNALPSISDDELISILEPYTHHVLCDGCQSTGMWLPKVYSVSELFDHFAEGYHHSHAMWSSELLYFPSWAGAVSSALELVGVGVEAKNDEALGAIGERWSCEGCSVWDVELAESNEHRRRFNHIFHGAEAPGRSWQSFVSHVLSHHLKGAAGSAPPTFKLVGEPAKVEMEVKAEE